MDLENYKNMLFNEQRIYLKRNFYNPEFITETKNNFADFIKNTHIQSFLDFINFYDLLLNQEAFYQEINDNILTIMDIEIQNIYPCTLYRILKSTDKDEILNNPLIQDKLIEYIQQAPYFEENFSIIEKYIKEDYHKELFLKQIKTRNKESKSEEEIEFTNTFIECLIKDPTYGTENIKYIGSGNYKDCFKLNDYILQVGSIPVVKADKKSEQIISPILFITYNNTLIAMTPYLGKVTEEEMKNCWFKAKDENILILDPIEDNFGKHLKDFHHPFKDITPLGKQFLGIDKFYIGDSKKDDIKLLDIDYYIDENDNSTINQEFKKRFKNSYIELNNEYKYEYEQNKQLKLSRKK